LQVAVTSGTFHVKVRFALFDQRPLPVGVLVVKEEPGDMADPRRDIDLSPLKVKI
jgi:hypothetical protein